MSTPTRASSSTLDRAMRGHVHGLRCAGTGWGAVVVAAEPAMLGRTLVASSEATAPSTWVASVAAPPVMAGTIAAAAPTSPRRRACAARANACAEAGRSEGFLAIDAKIRLRTGSATVTGSSGGASLIWAIAIATCDSPVNGRRPARAS